MKDQYKLCNQEKSSDLKVLYNRDNLRKEEIRVVKRDRCISITRGTNTDIVQTPKLLEDILLILHSNLVIDRKETTSKKDFVTGDLSANECDEVNEQSKTRNVPEIQNLLFVPLIVMDKNHDFYKQSNSCDTSMCNEDPKCSDFSQEVKRTCDQFPNSDENHKSFKDLRPGECNNRVKNVSKNLNVLESFSFIKNIVIPLKIHLFGLALRIIWIN